MALQIHIHIIESRLIMRVRYREGGADLALIALLPLRGRRSYQHREIVCVREREREKEKKTERERKRADLTLP